MRHGFQRLRRFGLLGFMGIGLTAAVACLPRQSQVEDTFLNAVEAFVLELGTSTINDVFTNANE